jgi:uncharacterized protein (DUF885 family)
MGISETRSAVAATAMLLAALPGHASAAGKAAADAPPGYTILIQLFDEWRDFERPVLRDHVPDYGRAAMAAKAGALPQWRKRLDAIDTRGWPVMHLDDYKLVKAEMNGLDFNLRILQPWARDPAFYVSVWSARSDVPLREAANVYPEIELYAYRFPLSPAAQQDLAVKLGAIPSLLTQARENLKDSNARDLWVYGIQELRNQSTTLAAFAAGSLTVTTLEGSQHADIGAASAGLKASIRQAQQATDEFIGWLEHEASGKTGASGVGKENYTWYQRNVHFVPFNWDEEVVLLRRELERAQAALKLEEHNNRSLPQIQAVADPQAFSALTQQRLDKFLSFLIDKQVVPDKPYLRAALIPQLGHFVPEQERVFFTRVTHREPMLLYSHDYHWFDLARMRDEPHASPIRRRASLSNIWDGRAEGFATAFEEIVMHAGLYDDNPRAKELVWIMLANRAARGLASLYVQANEWDLQKAGKFHAAWTPRGWANPKDSLTGFEQLLYLRQPGYGTSYIVGKILVDRLMAEYGQQQQLAGQPFVLRDFLDGINGAGMVPVPLIEDELIAREARLP